MNEKNKKEKFNFVSMNEIEDFSLENKKDSSISSTDAILDVDGSSFKHNTSDDAIIDIDVSSVKHNTSDDAVVDIDDSSVKHNTSDDAIVDIDLSSFNKETSGDTDFNHFTENEVKDDISIFDSFGGVVVSNEISNENEDLSSDSDQEEVETESVEESHTDHREEDREADTSFDESEVEISEEENEKEISETEAEKETVEDHEKNEDTTEERDSHRRPTVKVEYNDLDDIDDKKGYFGFGKRIVILAVILVAMLIGCVYSVYQALQLGYDEVVQYTENSDISYSVCDKGLTGSVNCSSKDLDYSSEVIHSIKTTFNYDVKFSKKIDYDMSYRIVAVTKIMDETNQDKVLYKNEDLLFTKTYPVNKNGVIQLNNGIDLDFEKYNQYVLDYMEKYNLNTKANLDVVLYVDDVNETREIASMQLSLGKETFKIHTQNSNNNEQEMKIINSFWNDSNSFYAFISIVLMLSIFLIIYRIVRLVLMIKNTHNRYQVRLNYLLREYDRLIVIARDGYESNVRKQVIRVNNFEELLDARSKLEKPIIFSRINDVKSEFIVEDDDKLYKFVLKEADL